MGGYWLAPDSGVVILSYDDRSTHYTHCRHLFRPNQTIISWPVTWYLSCRVKTFCFSQYSGQFVNQWCISRVEHYNANIVFQHQLNLPLLYIFEKGCWCVRRLSYKIFRGKEKCVVITTMDPGGLISMCYLHIWPFDCTTSGYLFFFFLSHLSREDAHKITSLTAGWSLCSVVWDDEDSWQEDLVRSCDWEELVMPAFD